MSFDPDPGIPAHRVFAEHIDFELFLSPGACLTPFHMRRNHILIGIFNEIHRHTLDHFIRISQGARTQCQEGVSGFC